MRELYVGLMSGTSLDGVDCVIYDFNTSELVGSSYVAFDDGIKRDIKKLTPESSLEEIAQLDITLSNIYSNCVLDLLKKQQLTPKDIIAIGSHGQTIYHNPKVYSWQLGNGARIARATGITTISDFRLADILAGGQGAPLTPKYHKYLLGGDGVVVNLGGIANLTCIEDGKIIGFDSGPANTLVDNYMLRAKGVGFDRDGLFARSGEVLARVLEQMLKDEYFSLSHPKSTGVEYFNTNWVDNFLTGNEQPQDVVRTLVELTAVTIAHQIPHGKKVYLCGGGVFNQFLCERITYLLPDDKISTTNELGVHPNFVEAIAFAYFAKLHIEDAPANVPSVTGATRETILGIRNNG